MTEDERRMFTELDGTVHLQGALIQSLLYVLADRGLLNRLEETDLFNMAEMRLRGAPQNEARAFARNLLRQWQANGLLDSTGPCR
jgi:hypothetical protein